jgi:hypothetical protein
VKAKDRQTDLRADPARRDALFVERDHKPAVASEPGGEDPVPRAAAALRNADARAETAPAGPLAQTRRAERARTIKARPSKSSPEADGASGELGANARTQPERRGESASEAGLRSLPGDVQSPQDREEMRQLAQSEQLLASQPGETLRLVREGDARFPRGYFRQERRYLEVMALFALGQHGEARARASWFLRDYPTGPYRKKVERALEQYAP